MVASSLAGWDTYGDNRDTTAIRTSRSGHSSPLHHHQHPSDSSEYSTNIPSWVSREYSNGSSTDSDYSGSGTGVVVERDSWSFQSFYDHVDSDENKRGAESRKTTDSIRDPKIDNATDRSSALRSAADDSHRFAYTDSPERAQAQTQFDSDALQEYGIGLNDRLGLALADPDSASCALDYDGTNAYPYPYAYAYGHGYGYGYGFDYGLEPGVPRFEFEREFGDIYNAIY